MANSQPRYQIRSVKINPFQKHRRSQNPSMGEIYLLLQSIWVPNLEHFQDTEAVLYSDQQWQDQDQSFKTKTKTGRQNTKEIHIAHNNSQSFMNV